MKLTKDQALELIKALSHYQIVCETTRVSCLGSSELLARLRTFVLDEPELGLDPVPEGVVLVRDDVNESDEIGCSSAESTVLGMELHDLSAVQAIAVGSSVARPNDEVTIEFEHVTLNVTDMLVNGIPVNNVTFIRRTEENDLLVAERHDGSLAWHRFHVQGYPKGWTELLPVEDLIEIE